MGGKVVLNTSNWQELDTSWAIKVDNDEDFVVFIGKEDRALVVPTKNILYYTLNEEDED